MNGFSRHEDGPVLVERRIGFAGWKAGQLVWASEQVKKCGVILLVDVADVEYDIGNDRTGETLEPVETALVA